MGPADARPWIALTVPLTENKSAVTQMLLCPQACDPAAACSSCRPHCSGGSYICGWNPATICVSGPECDGDFWKHRHACAPSITSAGKRSASGRTGPAELWAHSRLMNRSRTEAVLVQLQAPTASRLHGLQAVIPLLVNDFVHAEVLGVLGCLFCFVCSVVLLF
jgi:hypothetical protein